MAKTQSACSHSASSLSLSSSKFSSTGSACGSWSHRINRKSIVGHVIGGGRWRTVTSSASARMSMMWTTTAVSRSTLHSCAPPNRTSTTTASRKRRWTAFPVQSTRFRCRECGVCEQAAELIEHGVGAIPSTWCQVTETTVAGSSTRQRHSGTADRTKPDVAKWCIRIGRLSRALYVDIVGRRGPITVATVGRAYWSVTTTVCWSAGASDFAISVTSSSSCFGRSSRCRSASATAPSTPSPTSLIATPSGTCWYRWPPCECWVVPCLCWTERWSSSSTR